MADIQITDRAGKRPSPKRVRPIQNTAIIMDMGNLKECMSFIDEFIRTKAADVAREAGLTDGVFPAAYRRLKEEINEVGMPIPHLINKGVSHRDFVQNMLRAVWELQNKVQSKEFTGRWRAEKVEFWSSVRVVNHDASPTGGSEDARLAIAGLSSLGAATVEQVNLTEAGMPNTTSDTRSRSNYDVEVIGITVTYVDMANSANVRREKGEVVSGSDIARDQGLANSAAALSGAVTRLAEIVSPASVAPEEKVHHKTAEKMKNLETATAQAQLDKQKAVEEKDALAAKIAALEAQLAATKK